MRFAGSSRCESYHFSPMSTNPPSAAVTGVRRNPYVFVVGCPRSGTTLLQRMLDHHPELAVANDTHFIPRVLEPDQREDQPLTDELVERVLTYRRFGRLGLPEQTVREIATRSETFAGFVTGLYSEFARLQGKPLAGEKTPDYVRSLPLLHILFPWVRTVHIIRDGRDVALSVLDWAQPNKGPGRYALWQEHPVAVCALWWRRQVESGRDDGAAIGDAHYREVAYETLVARPEKTLRGMARYLNLPFAPEMVTYYEGKVRPDPGLSAKSAWLPPTPGLRNWRTEMPRRDVEMFEAIAGNLLTSLGYERASDEIGDEISATAERCRRWWRSEMIRRAQKRARRVGGRPRTD